MDTHPGSQWQYCTHSMLLLTDSCLSWWPPPLFGEQDTPCAQSSWEVTEQLGWTMSREQAGGGGVVRYTAVVSAAVVTSEMVVEEPSTRLIMVVVWVEVPITLVVGSAEPIELHKGSWLYYWLVIFKLICYLLSPMTNLHH